MPLLLGTRIKAENGSSLRGVEDCALVRGQVDPVTALGFSGHLEACEQISVRIEFEKSVTASGLPNVGVSSAVKDDRFRFAVVAGTEVSDHGSAAGKLSHTICGEIGNVAVVHPIE